MKGHLKQAAITTFVVLAGIFILRKLPVVGPMVDQAITG